MTSFFKSLRPSKRSSNGSDGQKNDDSATNWNSETFSSSTTHQQQQQQQLSSRSVLEQRQLSSRSVLVIGSTGQIGTETIRQFSQLEHPPRLFGMNHSFKTISNEVMELHCRYTHALIEGDATKAVDIHRALLISNPDTIIVTIADQNNTHIQTQSSKALMQVLRHPPFRKIHFIVVSLQQKSLTRLERFLPQMVKPKRRRLRDAERRDLAKQQQVLASDPTLYSRTTIVRPTTTADYSTHRRRRGAATTTTMTATRDLVRQLVYETIRGANYLQPGQETTVQHSISLPEQETSVQHSTSLPDQETTVQHSISLPEQETSVQYSTSLPEQESTGKHPISLPCDTDSVPYSEH